MPVDFKKEWMEKSAIDYFSPFISLWLACNSWYMSHYSDKENPVDLLRNPRINQDGTVHAGDIDTVIALDKIYIVSDLQNCFAGIFEIIYQVRNMLVHGKLNPDKAAHDVVKYCYRILWELMN